jgi:hypothetical protein
VRQLNATWIAVLLGWFRSGLTGFLGLVFLIVLSVLLVWPLWYLATSHTYLYSLAMLLSAGGFLGFMVFGRIHKVSRKSGRRGMSHASSVLRQSDPGEQAE